MDLSLEVKLRIGSDNEILAASENARRVTGIEATNLIGSNFSEYFDARPLILLRAKTEVVCDVECQTRGCSMGRELVGRGLSREDGMIELRLIDVTRHIREQASLQCILQNAKDILYSFRTHPEFRFEYVSPAVVKELGYKPSEFYGNSSFMFDICHPDDLEITYKKMLGEADYQMPIRSRFLNKTGDYVWLEDRVSPVYDSEGIFRGIEGACRNVTQQIARQRELEVMSKLDTLTQAGNRRAFEQAKVDRQGLATGIIVCDIDKLKEVNDHFGHDEGDRYIRSIATQLHDICTLANGELFRYGGDEFVIMVDTDHLGFLEQLSETIEQKVKSIEKPACSYEQNVSIGYAHSSEKAGDLDQTFVLADSRMYEMKNGVFAKVEVTQVPKVQSI